jgi:TrmH family RNA methyltransferase
MMPRPSDSGSAPLKPLKWYKKLATEKGRLEAGAFLVEGEKALSQVISCRPAEIAEIVTDTDLPASYRDYPVRLVTASQLRSLCSTKTPQGPLAVVRLPQDAYSTELPEATGTRILLLEDVQDPGNVGTLIRTAAAFGYSGVLLTDKCADPFSPKCIQSTAGAVLATWIRRTARWHELVKELKGKGFRLVAADPGGTDDTSVLRAHDGLLLALGNEARGLSRRVLLASDHRLKIPVDQTRAESLNVAACGAICMYISAVP